MPDRLGRLDDVALGYDAPDGYLSDATPYFGSTVGRVANRVRRGRFAMDGKRYALDTNGGAHHLHGGRQVNLKANPFGID